MKRRGVKLHLAFICADPKAKTFTVAKVRAWDMDEAWVRAAERMQKAGWSDEDKVIFLGHVA